MNPRTRLEKEITFHTPYNINQNTLQAKSKLTASKPKL